MSNGPKHRKPIKCRLEGCGTVFTPKVHNQTFCNKECVRIHTNKRILAAYHAKKNAVMTGRICASKDCGTILSRYNEGTLCSIHEKREYVEKIRDWGWDSDAEGNVRF